tara:strand:+ start:66 stop:875 length:810 start_codon:yes stop_codon:yes gene_type:complete
MNYTEKIKNHLSKYKEIHFPKLENGIWKNNKKPYSHILPEINKFDNLLEPYKTELENYISNFKIKPHSDFHHLNSSQAMCLNFFFPLFKENKLELVTEFLGFKNEKVNYESVRFEKDGLEFELGSRKPTSFDFFFNTVSNKKFYFEIKYTEDKFGNGSLNIDNFNKYYSKSLKTIKTNFKNAVSFYENYQILRNIIHIDDNSFVIFVYPKENENIRKGTEKVKKEFLNPKYHNNFYNVHWVNLYNSIIRKNDNGTLKKYFNEFEKKYLP